MKITIVTVLCLMASACLAQKSIVPVLSALTPKDILTNVADNGFGIGLRYHRALSRKFEAFGAIEYLSFGKKTINSNTSSKSTMFPLQLGACWFLSVDSNKRFYISGQAGVHYLTTDATFNGVKANVNDETKFSYSPGVGLRFRQLDIGYRMQWIGTSQTLRYSAVTVAYLIQIGSK